MEPPEQRAGPDRTTISPIQIAPEDALSYYRGIFWAAMDTILVADGEGRYLDANPAATALLGYTREELLGMGVANVVAPGGGMAIAEYERFLRDGAWSGELEVRRKDGSCVTVEAHATVVRPSIYLSVIRDVSQRRAAERAQQDVLAMMGHELKTPLTAILAHAQLMRRRTANGAAGASHTDAIIAQAVRLRRLIDDLLDATQLTAGQITLHRSATDPTNLARDAALQATTVTPTHPVRVEAAVGTRPLIGYLDADRVAQVLQNLLANAGKYSPAGQEILVQITERDGEALIEVRDRGVGIAPDEIPRLFDRFYRTASATQSSVAGLGLGLHICKLLVEAHGGRIWVESAVGQGTDISFTLPLGLPAGG